MIMLDAVASSNGNPNQISDSSGSLSTEASIAPQSSGAKAKSKPFPWADVPAQTTPERLQGAADLRAILNDPDVEYDLLARVVGRGLYLFSGSEMRRIILGLITLLETNEPPPLKCRQCDILEVPRLQWRDCQGGKRHIRASCSTCGAWIKFVSRSPAAVAEANRNAPLQRGGTVTITKKTFYSDRSNKPVAEPPNFGYIPDEMKKVKRWVMWKYEWVSDAKDESKGKWDKPPYQTNGKLASTTDKNTWATFEEAVAAFKTGKYSGVGFVFSFDDIRVGVDLDNVRNPKTGELTTEAAAMIERFSSYTEISPSGLGVKTFGIGIWPATWNKKQFGSESEIEGYSDGRYFTVTGNTIGSYPFVNIQRALKETVKQFENESKKSSKKE